MRERIEGKKGKADRGKEERPGGGNWGASVGSWMGLMYEQVFRVPGHKAWIRENLEKAKKGTTWLLGAKERRISDTWGDPHRRLDRKSTRLNSSHSGESRMPSSA